MHCRGAIPRPALEKVEVETHEETPRSFVRASYPRSLRLERLLFTKLFEQGGGGRDHLLVELERFNEGRPDEARVKEVVVASEALIETEWERAPHGQR
jgi:hypothetical protein